MGSEAVVEYEEMGGVAAIGVGARAMASPVRSSMAVRM